MTLSKRKKNISIKLMTLQTKQLIIIHANNINAKKKKMFPNKTLIITLAFCFKAHKNKRSPYHIHSPIPTLL